MRKSLLASAFMLTCSLAAMAISPSGHGDGTMSRFKFKAEQPQKVFRQSNRTYFQDLTSEAEKERLARKGIIVSHSFEAPSIEDARIAAIKAPMREDEPTYTLTVNLKYDKEEIGYIQLGSAYPDYTQDYIFFYERPEESTPDKVEYILPEGNYDIELNMQTIDMDFLLLTATDVSVKSDCEITLDAADATVEIIWNALLPDGTAPFTESPVYDPETFEVLEYVDGNVLSVYNSVNITNKKHNRGSSMLFNPLTWFINDTKVEFGKGNIKTMPNKDYVFSLEKIAISTEGGCLVPLRTDAMQSVTVTNDVSNYVTFKPEFVETPYQPEPIIIDFEDEQLVFEFNKNRTFCVNYATIQNGQLTGNTKCGLMIYEEGEPIEQGIYFCQDTKADDEYQIMPIPTFYEDFESDYNSMALPINGASSEVLALNNTSVLNDYLKLPNDRKIYINEVTNPCLSFLM